MNKLIVPVAFLMLGFSLKAQQLMINELSASVTNSQVDNYGEFEDWIEVFNPSKLDVNLAGWYLSDKPDNPLKWRIPATNPRITTIPGESYLLLWADKDTLQGPDHLGFSLKKSGERLYLFSPSPHGPVLADSVAYGGLPSDQSYGRCPEQKNGWVVFKHPTPGKPNVCIPEKGKR
jgi:hypothetical protein